MSTPTARQGLSLGFLALLAPLVIQAQETQPKAPIRPVTDTYFGTEVVDNYRYLENLKDPEVQAWMKGQAGYTRSQLDKLPGREALLERIHALSNSDPRRGGFIQRGQRFFYLLTEPGAQQPKLYYRDGVDGKEQLLLDPAKLGEGTTTHYALDYYTPSWDGKLIAYGVSAGGSEISELRVMDVATGKSQGEAINRTDNAIVSWRPDNRSFFYLRFPKATADMAASETQFNARTYLHVVGKNANGDADPVVFGRGVAKGLNVPEGQGTWVISSPDTPYAIAVANHNMDENPSTFYVAPLGSVTSSNTPWRKLADVADGVTQVEARGDKLYYLSQNGASRFRLLATPLSKPDLKHPEVIVPEGDGVLTGFAFAKEGIYVRERAGAVSRLKLVSFDGKQSKTVPLPFEGAVYGPTTDSREAGALFNMQSWVQAPAIYRYDPASNQVARTALVPASKVDTSAFTSTEVLAVSYDGTRVPLSIIHKKGVALDGKNPTILDGYGSYGISIEPYFSAASLAWVERGGILAIAHVRGGGEYGEAWHTGGQFRNKPNTILDFIACGQYLVDKGYTSPRYLAGTGTSAGGILIGGAMTWRPDLFGVILDVVGMSDTLRSETEPNGPPNVSEFGSVKTQDGFHGLYAMSPYLRIRAGTAYPAVMYVTGANDMRVAPWHMAKMAASTQAATSSQRPVLLRIDYDAGHGIGSNRSQREQQQADMWSFALWQMGDPAFQPVK